MSEFVKMVIVVPMEIAQDLVEKKRIKNYNSLPQLNKEIINAVREFMTDNVGYDDLPMACLGLNTKTEGADSSEVAQYLPSNSKDSVFFLLQMPKDMIISIPYQDLLSASEEANAAANDPDSLEFIIESFKDQLTLGADTNDDEEIIEFIPFLEYDRCKKYAKFNDNFETTDVVFPGIERCSLARLSAFID